MTGRRQEWGCNANSAVFPSHAKIRILSRWCTKTYMKVSGEPVQTGVYQCITFVKLCYRYSMFMFQKNALERGLLKQQKSLDLLANVYTSCPSAYL